MRKEVITHLSFLIAYFLFITIFRNWFDLFYLAFWIGGLGGILLPHIDYLLYVYVLKPKGSVTSVLDQAAESNLAGSLRNMTGPSRQRMQPTIHNAQFQAIFLLFALFVVTSSGSLLGRGIVLGFLLHLLLDQIVDWVETKNVDDWFKNFPIALDQQQKKWWIWGQLLALILLGLFF